MVLSQRIRVLIIDQDAGEGRFLGSYFARRGFEVNSATTSEEGLRMARLFEPSLVVLDLSADHGLETLERLKQGKTDLSVIVLSSEPDPELMFRASKLGADDFLRKPFMPHELEARITRILDRPRLNNEVPQLRDQVRRNHDFTMLFGTSPKMEEVKNTIEQVADTTATVLIRGESGTGKEVVARMVHSQSSRTEKPFVKVNCAAIPHELLESELFGYEPGAFTGAHRQKLGKFDMANQGTIFLDEISEMHPALQAKLLHVLQDKEFSRLGGKGDISVDVRVLSATNKPLERAVAEGAFREDLFYRLNVITIHIPPLRERREEIAVFLDFFLHKYSEVYHKNPKPFSETALTHMSEYHWPGNIRELENLVKRYVIVGNEAQIIRELTTHKSSRTTPDSSMALPLREEPAPVSRPEIPPTAPAVTVAISGPPAAEPEVPSLLEIGRRAALHAEREAMEKVLNQTRWNRRQAAKILKISYKALLNKLKAFEEQDAAHNKNLSA